MAKFSELVDAANEAYTKLLKIEDELKKAKESMRLASNSVIAALKANRGREIALTEAEGRVRVYSLTDDGTEFQFKYIDGDRDGFQP